MSSSLTGFRSGTFAGFILVLVGSSPDGSTIAEGAQVNIPDGFEVIEPARTVTVRTREGQTIERQVPAVIGPAKPDGPQINVIEALRPLTIVPPGDWHATPVTVSIAGFGAVWYDPVIPVCWESADPASAQTRCASAMVLVNVAGVLKRLTNFVAQRPLLRSQLCVCHTHDGWSQLGRRQIVGAPEYLVSLRRIGRPDRTDQLFLGESLRWCAMAPSH